VGGIGILGDVEVFLNYAARIGEEGPVSADPRAIFAGLGNVVGADCDQPTIGNFEFTVELNESFRLPAVLGTETSPAEDEDHWMLSLQIGELPMFRSVIGKLVVGERSSWNNVRSHINSPQTDGLAQIQNSNSE
jgi:hypothetical protein